MQQSSNALETHNIDRGGYQFSNEPLHVTFEKLWNFKDFNQNLDMLLAFANAAKSAKICQNLPKNN
jgi:hypothetical protein